MWQCDQSTLTLVVLKIEKKKKKKNKIEKTKSIFNDLDTCIRFKPQYYKQYGLLKQISIPEWLWKLISIDFIEKLLSLL